MISIQGSQTPAASISEERCQNDKCSPECTDPWEEKDGQCYLWSQEKLFWGAAEEKCRSLGGHLASVTTQDVQDYLLVNVRKC